MKAHDISADRSCDDDSLNPTALMRQNLPALIAAVKTHWCNYQVSPDHDRINAMRGEIQLLVYWLARRVAMASHIRFEDESGRPQQMVTGAFGGGQITDLQHGLWADVLSKRTVTELVQSTKSDLVAMLTRMLVNAKVSRYRRHRLEDKSIIALGDMGFPDNEDNDIDIDDVAGPDFAQKSAEDVYTAIQCLELFETFLAAKKLNPKLEAVAWALWMSAPLSDRHAGDTSDNKANQDAALAEQIDMPKKTFERYKYQARSLVDEFRETTGW